jgi:1-aminocyclopropane-1-carboxylate deaminase/D-cysteine desulfhydrase-like pyridoxal-dependent ACC family enzyme
VALDGLDDLFRRRVDLGATGTPLERLDRLRARLGGGPRLWVKRDDLMSRGLGGNKLRKLELLLHDARAEGAGAIGTIGRPTSNHARLTAAACRLLDLECHAFLMGLDDAPRSGNAHLLDLLGARVHALAGGRRAADAEREARARFAEACAADGRRGFWITWGANSVRGALGYVLAAREIAAQLAADGERLAAVFLAMGTGGTLAGLAPGAALFLPGAEVVAYAVSPAGAQVAGGLPDVAEQVAAVAAALEAAGAPVPTPRFRVEHSEVGEGYARPTAAAGAAARLLAETEALFVDPVYTAKALAGLLAELRAARYADGDAVLFLHTGGTPELFAPG